MEKSSNVVIGVIIAAVVVAGGVWFAMSRNDKEEPKTADSSMTSEQQAPTQNIVEIAAGNPDFSTLVTAVKAAGLAETLSGEGPFTVFAPTNAAFEKLPAGTVESLLKPENKTTLAGILTYHVVPAKAMSTDLKDGQVLTTVQGGQLKVNISNGTVTLTDAKGGMSTVSKADIAAKNGVIHVIDTVVMPN